MNFKQYFKLYLEKYDSFLDIPDEKPYGFWVSPSGNFAIVLYEQHYRKAMEIIDENPKLKARFDEYIRQLPHGKLISSGWKFLIEFGFTRVVLEGPIMYYSQNPRKPMTDKQKQTIGDLAEFYGSHPMNDGAVK